jgi:protein farnesyltransferase subunit beta
MSGDDSVRRPQRLVSNPKTRKSTRFPRRTKEKAMSTSAASTPRIEEIFDDSDTSSSSAEMPPYKTDTYTPYSPGNPYAPPKMPPKTPDLFSTLPVLRDTYATPSSIEQDRVASKVLPLLSSRDAPLPHLQRDIHIKFLEPGLDEKLPPYMTVLDASRPWIMYWCITGLSLLGVDVTKYRERYPPPSPFSLASY